jgi:hypothetical protein
MDKGRPELEVVKVFAPILLSILGAGAMLGVAATDVRDRYQWAADILVWTALPCLLASMIAVVYPFAIQRPKQAILRYFGNWLTERRERHLFSDWVRNWARYSEIFYTLNRTRNLNGDWWAQARDTFESVRPWLIQNEAALPADLGRFISNTILAQWPQHTHLDRGFQRHGFYYLFRASKLGQQIVYNDADEKKSRSQGHTLDGIWDGLTRYAAKRGWPAVEPWNGPMEIEGDLD